ncbi:MAG: hypothetical protein ABR605_09805 [Desulfurivibrionaceae bacterium]
MKKSCSLGLLMILLLTLSGCSGGGGDDRQVFEAQIVSDQAADGDIAFDPVTGAYTISSAPPVLFFGISPPEVDPNLTEFRAFLDFPLDGSTGEDVLPAVAGILSASLEGFVGEVSFAPRVPALIDLVTYPVDRLGVPDFDSPPILTQSVNFFPEDTGALVRIDITPLMREAQRIGLSDLQLRFLLDFTVGSGLVAIEDRPNVLLTAPLLTVLYVL